MKFIAINSALTAGPGSIAVHVDPPAAAEVFSRLKTITATRGLPVWLGVAANGLVTIEHLDRQEGIVTADILLQLEQLYAEAERLVAADKVAREEKHAQQVQRASEAAGLPVDTVAA